MSTTRFVGTSRFLSLFVLMAGLMACGEDPPPAVETVRAIRTITVNEPASGKTRRFSGVVEAVSTSSLSFELAGNVQAVEVEVGERVSEGQMLAVLDVRTFRLNVEAAQAAVGAAQAELGEAQSNLERVQRIAAEDRGAISERALEQAQATYDGARQNLSYNQTRLNLARRDLERTELRAPFDGVIAERFVDPFQEVARGEPMFELFMEGAMQAAISIPESEIDQIYLGLRGDVRFPATAGPSRQGIVTEVSKVAGAANAFPVKLAIEGGAGEAAIRPGTTVEVTLLLGGGEAQAAYLIPLAALSPRDAESGRHVYVFDPDSSTVVRTAVEGEGVRDSNVVVTGGLRAGDIIAVAGVSFLRDGQKVRLMGQ